MADLSKFSLEGKNAWVTGASYGIGFNIAKAFAEAGAKNIVFNARSEASLQLGLDNYKKFEYNEFGRKKTQYTYNPKGKLISIKVYEYLAEDA